ncbi:PDDEXK nuclease domain-containing protein [Faucicola boevrei]|uniref:PDDEXK nuclease domain-containing protein n=1 Tax=Faucicola boevrei TaxID=346665 RepID=UPI000379470A|nr:PDDEXK nuclease domain-containing protein [Moraxella boevrei]
MNTISDNLFTKIAEILHRSRQNLVQTVNSTMTHAYFEIGRMIVEDEQNGQLRAEYGKQQLAKLSTQLTAEFGKGFSERNLQRMRQFYLVYSEQRAFIASKNNELQISPTVLSQFQLSYSHYLKLMRIADPLERQFYEIESIKHNWSLRELERQYDTALFTRLSLSKNKDDVLKLALTGQVIEKPQDLIKDPYILEFLGLPEQNLYSENELENQLIDKLEQFLLELGAGFTFVGRQERISFDEQHFFVDLVFYNRLLRCFVLIDLKIGKLKHQDIGQMQMYVNFYDRQMKLDDENPTIGIILCQDKNQSVVEFTLPADNTQIFASRYQTILPSKEQLLQVISD